MLSSTEPVLRRASLHYAGLERPGRQFQVLAIDLPGFGRSEGRDDLFSPQTMGDFIVKAIDAFGVSRHTRSGSTSERRRSFLPRLPVQTS